MRKMRLTAAALFGAAFALPALAQMDQTGARPGHEPGVGMSYPESNRASNINGADARGQVAPTLPTPYGGQNASPEAYLRDAQRALSQRRTGAAQEALERAETAFLNNPANPADPTMGPVGGAMQHMTEQARQALGRGDLGQARQLVEQALAQGGGPMGNGAMTGGYRSYGSQGSPYQGSPYQGGTYQGGNQGVPMGASPMAAPGRGGPNGM